MCVRRPYNRACVRRDITRTLLVVAEQPQLWAAIRDRVDGELALVRHARPEQLAEVLGAVFVLEAVAQGLRTWSGL